MKVDVLVLGGGIDGLVAACFLARAGKRVALCEAGDRLGGPAAAEELGSGARTAGDLLTCAPPLGLLDPLGLEQHGLAWRKEPAPIWVAGDGEREGLLVHRDPARTVDGAGARLSESAASRYAELRARLARWAPAALPLLLDVPPEPSLLGAPLSAGARGLGQLAALGQKAWRLQRLGPRDLTDLLRAAPMAAFDFLEDELDDERLRAAFAARAIAGTTLGPRAPGTTASLLLDELAAGPEPVGGSPALVQALVARARAHGAELLTQARPRAIAVRGDAGAPGVLRASSVRVEREDGAEEIEAGAVLSTLDFATTVLDLIDPAVVPDALERAAQTWKRRARTAVVHLHVDGAFEPAGCPDAERAISTSDLNLMERASDEAKHDRLPESPWAELRAIRGEAGTDKAHTVVTLHVHAVPTGIEDPAPVEAAARAILARLAPDAAVTEARVKLPRDLEQQHGLAGGHLAGGELILDQLWIQRPALCASRYATPIAGLFVGGPSSHPGGGLPGGAGALAARAVLEDA